MAQVPAKRGSQGDSMARRMNPFDLFRRQLDALFEGLWGQNLAPSEEFGSSMRVWDFNVTEDDKEIVIRAELPGFEEKDLDVRIENDGLTIKAEKEQKEGEREEYRSFYRSVALPAGIDPEKVHACYCSGVLELRMPRPEGSQAKRIPIQGRQALAGQPAHAQPAAAEKPSAKSGAGSQAEKKSAPSTSTGAA